MFATQRFVSPKLPTTLANRTHVDLPGYDISFCYVALVDVIPAALDLSKFEDALARALQLYPHAAGQLRCVDGRWSIELTNTAIPVDIEYKFDTTSDSLLDDNWVVQDDLSPFLSHQPIHVDVVNDSAPLIRFKLTFFADETCVGMSWHHSLGDGVLGFRFKHTLSQFYQGLPLTFAAPSFEKHRFPSPTPSMMADFSPHVPQFLDPDQFNATLNELHKNLGHVRCRIDNQDLEELHSVLSSNGRDGKPLSKQDCLTAYLVTVLNHSQPNLIRKIKNIFNYREIKAPFISENVASNMMVQIMSEVPMDMAGIATAARDAAMQCRQPDYIYGWVSVFDKLILDAANTGKMLAPVLDDGLMVNSLAKVEFTSSHFGCPDGARAYLDNPWFFQLRFFKANPVKEGDGTWKACQSVELSLGVPADLKPVVDETLARGVRYMLNQPRARL